MALAEQNIDVLIMYRWCGCVHTAAEGTHNIANLQHAPLLQQPNASYIAPYMVMLTLSPLHNVTPPEGLAGLAGCELLDPLTPYFPLQEGLNATRYSQKGEVLRTGAQNKGYRLLRAQEEPKKSAAAAKTAC